MFKLPEFGNIDDEIKFVVENKSKIIASKTATIKHCDCIASTQSCTFNTVKSFEGDDKNTLKAVLIINTTNVIDSHKDVHIPGIWKKSLNENKLIMHLQEHDMAFDKIIADGDDLKAYTKTFLWKELGYDLEGNTEALMFDSEIKADRNPYMFKQYQLGRVKQHSVGMRYIKIFLAVNRPEHKEEFAAWEKYYPLIANKEDVNEYFYAVTEAKAIEGSAVVLGSNSFTPTLSIKTAEPSLDTQMAKSIIREQFKNLLS